MTTAFEQSDPIYHPSAYWTHLNQANNSQIEDAGIENFKRTVVKNYFTWMRILPWDAQIVFLVRALGPLRTAVAIWRAFFPMKHGHIPLAESLALNFITQMAWRYARRTLPDLMAQFSEPTVGNPPQIHAGSKLISQDIANSVLEFDAMNRDGTLTKARTMCELGGGYGRTAYVVQKLHPGCKYLMVDIPPALAIAQTYMREVFPERSVFGFRPFDTLSAVSDEIEAADIVCLLPHQMALSPDGYIDYFINISSLHEMHFKQIDRYLAQILRLVRPNGHFFLKSWKNSKIPFDDIEIRFQDYALDGWNPVYNRTARIQTKFFETLLVKTIT